ncbi:hypothetical protein niasHS_007987 [Heterodera schachtii]|uniref:Uncharacterized protein n=1 Tax=Heterodera schachtii TaxID=97005 RepID=A0ABD2JQA8_HETSC
MRRIFLWVYVTHKKVDGTTEIPAVPKSSAESPNGEAKENCLPEDAFCARNALSPQCLRCDFPSVCPLGDFIVVICTPSAAFVNCAGDGVVPRANVPAVVRLQAKCRFCWQLEQSEIVCEERKNCSTNELTLYRTKCWAKPNAICAGRRHFFKNVRWHWTSGHSWRKTLFLSFTLGGLGVDRFIWAIGKVPSENCSLSVILACGHFSTLCSLPSRHSFPAAQRKGAEFGHLLAHWNPSENLLKAFAALSPTH